MKLLLTSGGINNNSIRNALVDLLGKPIEQSTALFIPTAAHPLGPFLVWRSTQDLIELDWKEFGVLELTALPSIGQEHGLEHLLPKLEAADALLVGGGDPLYLCYWMQQSGLVYLLPSPSLREMVYVGLSAGSMVMAPNIGEDFVGWRPPTGTGGDSDSDRTLGLVDFAMFPHVDHEAMPDNSMANAERWAAGLTVPGYAIDDQTASK